MLFNQHILMNFGVEKLLKSACCLKKMLYYLIYTEFVVLVKVIS